MARTRRYIDHYRFPLLRFAQTVATRCGVVDGTSCTLTVRNRDNLETWGGGNDRPRPPTTRDVLSTGTHRRLSSSAIYRRTTSGHYEILHGLRSRGRIPAEDASSRQSRFETRPFSHGSITFLLQTPSCYDTSARYPTSPVLHRRGPLRDRRVVSMSFETISRPSIVFNTSPYPPCAFRQISLNRLRYSQLFDIAFRGCPSNTAQSRSAHSSLSSTFSQVSLGIPCGCQVSRDEQEILTVFSRYSDQPRRLPSLNFRPAVMTRDHRLETFVSSNLASVDHVSIT